MAVAAGAGGRGGPAASHAARRVCQTWPIRSARGNWGPARPARLRRRGIRGSRCPGPPSRAVRRRKPRRSRAPARRLLKARSDISRHSRHWRPTGLPPIHRMNRRTPRHQFTIWNRTLDDGARTCVDDARRTTEVSAPSRTRFLSAPCVSSSWSLSGRVAWKPVDRRPSLADSGGRRSRASLRTLNR